MKGYEGQSLEHRNLCLHGVRAHHPPSTDIVTYQKLPQTLL
jgi:hypothetical protein